ncbi:MAG: efflux RND transporter periplasmic adaptor subunit [Bacteroidia bacterium]
MSFSDELALSLTLEQQSKAELKFAPLHEDTFVEYRSLWGRTVILAHSQAYVHSPVEGIIREIFVREGQQVQKGQVLLAIHSPTLSQLQRDYIELKAQYQLVTAQLERQKDLLQAGRLTQMDLQAQETQKQTLQTRIRQVENQFHVYGILPDSTGSFKPLYLRAPISGAITQLPIGIGQYVTPQNLLCQIMNFDNIHADIQLGESDLAHIQPNQILWVRFPSVSQWPARQARVEYIAEVTSKAGQVEYIAHCLIPTYPGERIFSNLSLEARYPLVLTKVWKVPASAVVAHASKTYVFRKRDASTFEALEVSVKKQTAETWVIDGTLQEGDTLVTHGADFLAASLWQVSQE